MAFGTAVLVSAGCGVDPAQLSLPGAGVQGPTYEIHIQFANALNLPSHARVMANGVQVGQLRQVTVADPTAAGPGSVVADVDIEQSVRLPGATTAQLRQDTILGDIYIALQIPSATKDSSVIGAGGLIPIQQSQPALQIEDILTGLSTFVSGGALQSAQNVVNRVNAALPADPAETGRIAEVLKGDLIDVAAHQEDLGAFLDSIDVNARLLLDNRAQLDELLTPQGVVDITEIANTLIHTIGIIGAIGGLAHALTWIQPLVAQGDAAAEAFVPLVLDSQRPLNLSAPSNLNKLVEFLRDKLIPWAQRPTVDIHGVRVEPASAAPVSGDDQVNQIVAALRMIGMVR
ncbi:MlaD family protein [Nocardia sp. CDC160]|uniref:MlaD family protein n=1 Tax=Nocardia sp. CDC160 TaxID=3112166 RepID=UPI002DBC7347|nr:MlaD family protein [Nocardia sp. CDC160]MEC3919386.1 MlaD family protein [Nocardia sp. CDC160]